MTRRWIAAVAAVLLVAAVAGIWTVPAMLDWDRFRTDIASLVAERLGRPVRIGGRVALQLLPQPILTAHDVIVEDAGDGVALQARALRVGVSLSALLGGTLRTNDLVLQGADLRLPWPLPPALGGRPQAWFTGLRARVVDSRLQVGGVVLSGIDATLSTDPDTGSLSAAGVASLGARGERADDSRLWQFTVRLAQPGGDGAAPLSMSLDGQGVLRDTGGSFSGQVAADGTLAGRVAGRGLDLSLLLPAPAQPWRADGRFSASGGLAVADELALVIGGAPARGAVALRVQPAARLDLSVTAGRLDLDAWLPAMLQGAGGPGGIPTGIDLSADAATWAGGTLRRLRGAVDLPGAAGAGIVLREVSVVLPGEAVVILSGVAATQKQEFDGVIDVKAPDLPATLRWASWLPLPVANLPAAVLRQLAATAHVTVDADQFRLSDLKGSVNGTPVAGSLALKRTGRPGVTADLAFTSLSTDQWLPGPGSADLPAWTSGTLAALRQTDSDIKMTVDRADWDGVALGAATLDLQTDATRVVLRRLAMVSPGMRLAASGTVAADGRLTDGRLDVSTPDLGQMRPILTLVGPPPGAVAPLLRGPGSLAVQAAGPPEALAGRISAELADLRVDLQPVVNLAAGQLSSAMTLHHPGAPRLLETLGLGGTAAWLGDGSLSLVGQVQAAPGRFELVGGTLAAGSLRVTGHLGAVGRRVTGELVAESLPLPLPYARSPELLPFDWLRGWSAAVHLDAAEVLVAQTQALQRLSADLALDGGTLTLARITAGAQGAAVSGTVKVDTVSTPPQISVRGDARGVGITAPVLGTPVDLVAGLADVTVDMTGTGFSPAALLSSLAGGATGTVTEGVLAGMDLTAVQAALSRPTVAEAVAAAQAALKAGSTSVKRLDLAVTATRGSLNLDGTLRSGTGDIRVTGTVDLPTSGMDVWLLVRPDIPAVNGPGPEIGIRLSGAGDDTGRGVRLADLVRWLTQRPPP